MPTINIILTIFTDTFRPHGSNHVKFNILNVMLKAYNKNAVTIKMYL